MKQKKKTYPRLSTRELIGHQTRPFVSSHTSEHRVSLLLPPSLSLRLVVFFICLGDIEESTCITLKSLRA